ncbi:MAG TPA: hypothetical protein VF101_06170 [Gaiellaceae bacterium]
MKSALARFAVQVFLGVLVCGALSAAWAAARGFGLRSFETGLLVVGGLVLLAGALSVGGMSPSTGVMETSGRIPGIRAYFRTSPGTSVLLRSLA